MVRVTRHRRCFNIGVLAARVMLVAGTVLLLRHRGGQALLLHLPGHGLAHPAAQGEQEHQKDKQPASHGRMISPSSVTRLAAGQILRGRPRFSDKGPSLGYLH